MIKNMKWIVLMVVFFVNTVALAQIGMVTRKELLVRSGPGEKHKVIAKLKRGERPLLQGLRGNWLKLAWQTEAWVNRRGISLEQGAVQPLAVDKQFLRWLIYDTKVNWGFIDRKRGNPVSLWVRMDSDRYGSVAEVRFIASNLAESYRFHTGEKGPVEIKILKSGAKFIRDIYFQDTLE